MERPKILEGSYSDPNFVQKLIEQEELRWEIEQAIDITKLNKLKILKAQGDYILHLEAVISEALIHLKNSSNPVDLEDLEESIELKKEGFAEAKDNG